MRKKYQYKIESKKKYIFGKNKIQIGLKNTRIKTKIIVNELKDLKPFKPKKAFFNKNRKKFKKIAIYACICIYFIVECKTCCRNATKIEEKVFKKNENLYLILHSS